MGRANPALGRVGHVAGAESARSAQRRDAGCRGGHARAARVGVAGAARGDDAARARVPDRERGTPAQARPAPVQRCGALIATDAGAGSCRCATIATTAPHYAIPPSAWRRRALPWLRYAARSRGASAVRGHNVLPVQATRLGAHPARTRNRDRRGDDRRGRVPTAYGASVTARCRSERSEGPSSYGLDDRCELLEAADPSMAVALDLLLRLEPRVREHDLGRRATVQELDGDH